MTARWWHEARPASGFGGRCKNSRAPGAEQSPVCHVALGQAPVADSPVTWREIDNWSGLVSWTAPLCSFVMAASRKRPAEFATPVEDEEDLLRITALGAGR